MTMSTGVSISIPNVVRTAYHSTLVNTYIAYCKEADFEPLSKASLYKILSECPASKRTNLKGLDNIAAEGNLSFENIIAMIDQLEKSNITQTATLLECKEKLQSSKLYLKTEYKLHIRKESNCADHCLYYALSDETNSNLNHTCSHEHQIECEKCSDFKSAIVLLKTLISENQDLTKDKQDEMIFDVDTAERNINDWKCHIVRGVAQDLCRHEHFEKLSEHEVVVIMDWAMKFLPSMYREKQSDWFAQKGFNWHVIVCVFKDSESNLKHTTFVHVMDSAKQDWYSVACLLQHVLKALKQQRPMIATAFLRSDNAGCYHCSNLWNCLSGISNNTGIKIERYDFSESQNGKSYCDAKIAHMRGKLRNFVKMGGNITSAAEMKMALDSGNGVTGCQVAHVEICVSEQSNLSNKIRGISKISNVKFNNDSTTYWRNYNIGKGQNIPIVSSQFDSTLRVISDFKPPLNCYGTINKPVVPIPDHVEVDYNVELHCPDPQCDVILASYTDLNDHCLIGNHHYLSTYDAIRIKWKESCLDIATTIRRTTDFEMSTAGDNIEKKGWALKKERKNSRFPEYVKDYLKHVFEEGERSGCKSNPTTVSRNMRVCTDESGNKRFQASDYLNSSQVASYFSRLAAQTRHPGVVDADLDATIALINKAEALEEIDFNL